MESNPRERTRGDRHLSFAALETLTRTLMYEGYLLYPYRRSAVKNRYRWMFGTLYPRAFVETTGAAEPWWLQTECLVSGVDATVEVTIRFVHLAAGIDDHDPSAGPSQEPLEREVVLADRPLGTLLERPQAMPFVFADAHGVRRDAAWRVEPVRGVVALAAERAGEDLVKLTIRVENLTRFDAASAGAGVDRRDVALWRSLASTHTLVGVRGGEFVSLLDPPASARFAAAGCRNVGTWPVLAGRQGVCDTMLSSPIILSDYPQVARESPGDLFDATEIDELLTLRILTLTRQEKDQLRTGDPRVRKLLERTEGLGRDELLRLHGAVRARKRGEGLGIELRPGARVRLRPGQRGDILDIALVDQTATIVSIEEDYEGRVFVAVTLDDDPGRDLGAEGLPGHRFFFRPDEVEPLP